jgi:hypothetical protein
MSTKALAKRLAEKKTPRAREESTERVSLPIMSKKTQDSLESLARSCIAAAAKEAYHYPYTANPVAQYLANSRVTGEVTVKSPEGRKIAISLRDYWPNWESSDGGKTRTYGKHGQGDLIQRLMAGNVSHPLAELLEELGYCALSILKAREASPREGHIKTLCFAALERSGFKVESAKVGEVTYNRETIESKAAKLQRVVDGGIASGQYVKVRGRKQEDAGKVYSDGR